MKPLIASLLLLTGCTGAISFQRVEMMAMVDDERARYNLQAGLVNRACLAQALPVDECQAAADSGKDAVKQYAEIRAALLAKETVTADTIIHWLLVIGSAIAHAYGIPIPGPATVAAPLHGVAPLRIPTLPLMP